MLSPATTKVGPPHALDVAVDVPDHQPVVGDIDYQLVNLVDRLLTR